MGSHEEMRGVLTCEIAHLLEKLSGEGGLSGDIADLIVYECNGYEAEPTVGGLEVGRVYLSMDMADGHGCDFHGHRLHCCRRAARTPCERVVRAGTAFVSTDVESGHTECHLYLAAGGRIALDLANGEDNWHVLMRAFDQSGIAGAAHFERRNIHVVQHSSEGERPVGVLLESYELMVTTAEVSS